MQAPREVVRSDATLDEPRLKNDAPGFASIHLPQAPIENISVYVNSQGNYFFEEIGELIAAGFQQSGLKAELRDENDGLNPSADLHLVVAPHEFFQLGMGAKLRPDDLPRNLILLNTEQPSTQWFSLAKSYFQRAYRIWDMNPTTAQMVAEQGYPADFLPLGFVPDFARFGEVERLANTYGTCFLDEATGNESYLRRSTIERPIDVLFVGSLSPRREDFFAGNAACFARHRCYLHFWDAKEPAITGMNTHMDTATVVGLAQRSKIVLNIHRGADTYFEWQRIVLHGLWQRAAVITETCSETSPFESGKHLIEIPLDQIPEALDYYILSSAGRHEAALIAQAGNEALKSDCRLADHLERLLGALGASPKGA